MVSRISRLYGPKFNSDINSGLTNIASTFKAPSMTDVYLAQKMRDAQTTALAHKALQDKFATGETPGVADFYGAGITPADYEKYQTEHAMNEAARTGDYTKLDPYIAAQKGFGSTAAASLTKDIPAGNTFIAPASIAGMYGMRVPAPAADAAQPDGAATETDSKGQPTANGAFTFTAPEKSSDKTTLDSIKANYLKLHPELIPGAIAGKPLVQIGGDNKIEEAYGAGIGDQIKGTLANAQKAPEVRNNIQTMRNALASGEGNLTFGPGADTVQSAKKIFGSLTGQDLPGTAEADVINNLGFGLATAAVKDISSRPGQQEFVRALQVKPGLQMSKPGMLAALDLMEQNQNAHQDLAKLATDPENRKNWPTVVANYYQQNPLKSPFNPAKPLSADDAAALNASQSESTPDYSKMSNDELLAAHAARKGAAPPAIPAPVPVAPPAGTPGVDIGPVVAPVAPPANTMDYLRSLPGLGGP